MGADCCRGDSSIPDRQPLNPNKQPNQGEFTRPYMFKAKNTVIIRHSGGNSLRVDANGTGLLATGAKGKFARFEAIPQNNGNRVQFKSLFNGKYLRIHQKNVLDCGGGGGQFTVFKVQPSNILTTPINVNKHVKLESVHFPGQYIASDNKGPRTGKGGPFCKMEVYRI
eukprot:43262_1